VRSPLARLRRDEREAALVGFYGHLAQGMTRGTFIGGEGSRFLHGDRHGRSFYLPPNSASNAMFLTTLRYLLVQDWDLDDDGMPETLRLLYGAPGRWLKDGAVLRLEKSPSAFGPVTLVAESRLAARGAVRPPAAAPRPPAAPLLAAPAPAGRVARRCRASGGQTAGGGARWGGGPDRARRAFHARLPGHAPGALTDRALRRTTQLPR